MFADVMSNNMCSPAMSHPPQRLPPLSSNKYLFPLPEAGSTSSITMTSVEFVANDSATDHPSTITSPRLATAKSLGTGHASKAI